MTTLAVNTPITKVIGDRNEIPMIDSDIIYEGAAVGIVLATGHARPITSVDRFVGFAEAKADNSTGAAAAIDVRVITRGLLKLTVTGAVITDVGCAVYAQDDNAFSFIKTSGVFVGFMRRYVSAGVAEVEFDVDNFVDPHAGWTAETITTSTLDATAQGKVFFITADAQTITLPAVAGNRFRIVNGMAYGGNILTISPNGSDGIGATGLTAVDDKDLILTKATSCRGDYVEIENGDATGWIARIKPGSVWTKQG